MRRREFVTILLGAATPVMLCSPIAHAQRRMPRVGILLYGAPLMPRNLDVVAELARIGYVEKRDIVYEIRGADGDIDRLPQLARELVSTTPDVIVASATPAAYALAAATPDIPIVMTVVGDPIALGLTTSMSRPSRNVTGFTGSSISLAAKRLELLHDLVPTLRIVAYVWVPGDPLSVPFEAQVKEAADGLGIKLVSLPLFSEADIAVAFLRAEEEQVMAVLVETSPLTLRFSGTILDECLVRNLPAMHTWPFQVRGGALISYGPATIENYSRTATYIDRILKGARVAELPFEEPTQIRLAINLRTARSIGITIPPGILARADEVVE